MSQQLYGGLVQYARKIPVNYQAQSGGKEAHTVPLQSWAIARTYSYTIAGTLVDAAKYFPLRVWLLLHCELSFFLLIRRIRHFASLPI